MHAYQNKTSALVRDASRLKSRIESRVLFGFCQSLCAKDGRLPSSKSPHVSILDSHQSRKRVIVTHSK